jgi:hypothetical protein
LNRASGRADTAASLIRRTAQKTAGGKHGKERHQVESRAEAQGSYEAHHGCQGEARGT